jgi:ferredoxin
MSDFSIAVVYFSATHVTKTYADVIEDELRRQGCEVQSINVTSYDARNTSLPFDKMDGCIFGFPVFADFAPSIINKWIPTLEGKGTPCTTFFTYGARTTGYAHFHTKLLLEQAGFRVRCTAEFLGRHTFNLGGWQILPDRPDDRDFAVAREFATVSLERLRSDALQTFTLQKPFGYNQRVKLVQQSKPSAERGWRHPVREGNTCQMCRKCETECPTQAFDADTGLSDPLKCLECLHCVYICPDHVLHIDDRIKGAYEVFLEDWCLTEDMINAKQSKIITEAWQAAC